MKLIDGAPVFAVEVRSEGDYGPAAEQEMAEKRADYFAAGTKVVWDVDLNGPDVVRIYRAGDTARPTIYRRGQLAEAEPAIPGWTPPVDDLFPAEHELRIRDESEGDRCRRSRPIMTPVAFFAPLLFLRPFLFLQFIQPLPLTEIRASRAVGASRVRAYRAECKRIADVRLARCWPWR
jgi:hypothetical protein